MAYDLKKILEEKSIPEPNTGCWLWLGELSGSHKSTHRYGKISFKKNGKWSYVYAHRASYQAFKGEVGAGLSVCHRCDQTYCVNPDHLFLGTQADNMADMNKKGRNIRKNCIRGHLLDGDNVAWRTKNGRDERVCRICLRQRIAKWKRSQRDKRRAHYYLRDENGKKYKVPFDEVKNV